MDKKERLKNVRKCMDKFVELRKQSHKICGDPAELVSQAMRDIFMIINPDIINKIEGFIGHDVMGVDGSGSFFIMNVERVKYEKWEFHLYGKGIEQVTYCGKAHVRENRAITVKYEEVPNLDSKFELGKEDPQKFVTEYLENRRKQEMEALTEKLNQRFDAMLNEAKCYLEGREPERPVLKCSCDKETPRSILQEETGFRWSELYQAAGVDFSEEAQAAVGEVVLYDEISEADK